MVGGVVGTGLGAGLLPRLALPNPFALPGAAGEAMALLARLATVLSAVLIVGAVLSLLLRYRRSDETGRLQLKWFASAAIVLAVVGTIFLAIQETAFKAGSAIGDIVWLAFCAAATLIPIAALVAITRHNLYQIDTIIGRTFVYAGLTAILAGLYAASIRLFTWLFVEVTGESSDAALVLTTLVLATTFTPIKGRLEKVAATHWGEEDGKPARALDLDDEQIRALAERVATLVRSQLEPEPAGRRRRHGV
jgi:hypothetical protein